MKIDYSFIIPHRNAIQLLLRCVQSIPMLDYVEVIIIDDNSDDIVVQQLHDFTNSRKNLKVVFKETNLGAGAARNIGIQSAIGRWLIFADCDDFFNLSLIDNLIKYRNEAAVDVIYFNTNSVDSTSLKGIKSRGSTYNKWIQNSIKNKHVDPQIRYRINPPWGKMVSRNFILDNNIYFDEVFAANDVMFAVKVGHTASSIILSNDVIYCATDCPNSIQKKTSLVYQNSRFKVGLNNILYLESIGKSKYRMNIWKVIFKFYCIKDRNSLIYYIKETYKIMRLKYFVLDFLKMPLLSIKYIINSKKKDGKNKIC